jgi:hypothetical protein
MRSRFVSVPNTPKAGGLASRVAGAIAFFFVGAVAATELYPQMVPDRHSEYRRASDSERAAPSPAPNPTSDRIGASSLAEYRAGPIPEPTFAPIQLPAAAKEARAQADEAQAASDVRMRKPRVVKSKYARNKGDSRRRNANSQDRVYQGELPYRAAGTSWNPWGDSPGGFHF